MSELRVGATVDGTDGALGELVALIVDPVHQAVTHLVVSSSLIEPRTLVPVTMVTDASPDAVAVDLDLAGFAEQTMFDEPDFKSPEEAWAMDELALSPGTYYLEPFASPLDGVSLSGHERIPRGEVAARRGMEVLSSDGTKVGHVDEFLVDPADGHITHVVLRQGHALRHDDDVVIPVGSATRFEDGRVILDLDLPAVAALEKIPVHRHGHVQRG